MKRSKRISAVWLALVLLALLLGVGWLRTEYETGSPTPPPPIPRAAQPIPVAVNPVAHPAHDDALAPAVSETSIPRPAPGKSVMQAYQLALKGGVVSLEATQRLEGDFHRRRGPLAWMPGMWCVRLLDAEQRVLAQETTLAPDEPCVVNDPRITTPAGAPVPSALKVTDEVLLQVRLPLAPEARWINVYRLAGSVPAGPEVIPEGQLLATIALSP